jgi:hypothetical protein
VSLIEINPSVVSSGDSTREAPQAALVWLESEGTPWSCRLGYGIPQARGGPENASLGSTDPSSFEELVVSSPRDRAGGPCKKGCC